MTQQHLLAASGVHKDLKPFIISKKKRVTPFALANNLMFQSAPKKILST